MIMLRMSPNPGAPLGTLANTFPLLRRDNPVATCAPFRVAVLACECRASRARAGSRGASTRAPVAGTWKLTAVHPSGHGRHDGGVQQRRR